MLERDVEPEEERHGRRERARALGLALRRPRPSRSSSGRRRAARAARSSARSETEANASPGGVMSAFCEPATTTSMPHSSCSQPRVAPRPETASTTSSAPWRRATSASARTSCTIPVEVSDSVANTTSTPGLLAQHPVDLGGVEAHAPARLVLDQLGAVGLAELDPALAELARRRARAPACRAGRGWRPPTPSRPSRSRRTRAPGWRCRRRRAGGRARARRARRKRGPGGRASAPPSPGRPRAGPGSARRS